LPFYTLTEAEKVIDHFEAKDKEVWIPLSGNIRFRFRYNGHILGATFIELEVFKKIFVFSGDIGRTEDTLLAPPERPQWADYLFIEATYGNKLHPVEDVDAILADLVYKTTHERGNLIIPSFAVERMQSLMYTLWQLYRKNKIPNIPVFVDSPMGTNVLEVFKRFPEWHRLSMKEYHAMCQHFIIIGSYAETWNTIDDPRPKIIIAGSGMVTGGRVLTYLRQYIDLPATCILLIGYQAEGTRGRQLLEGAHELKFFGKYYPVKATIRHLESLSAHADQNELLEWMGDIRNIPETVFLIHGESLAMDAFRVKIQDVYGSRVYIPKLNETLDLAL
jgi:metallo-beta-lactamase family protein